MATADRSTIDRAARILLAAGARSVYVFGSAADSPGAVSPNDIDLAVEGMPRGNLFRVVGDLMCELRTPVDVIDLDRPTPFVRRLRESGRLRRVA